MNIYSYGFLLVLLSPVLYQWGRRKRFEFELSKRMKAYVLSTYGPSAKIRRLRVDQCFSKFIPFNQGATLTYYREVSMNEGETPVYFKIIRPGSNLRKHADTFHLLDTYQVFQWEKRLTDYFDPFISDLMPNAVLVTTLHNFKLGKDPDDLNGKSLEYVLRTAKPMTYFDIYAPTEGFPDMERYLQYAFDLKGLIQKRFLKQEFILTIRFPKDTTVLSDLNWLKAKAMNSDASGFYPKRIHYYCNRFTDNLSFNEFTSECLRIK